MEDKKGSKFSVKSCVLFGVFFLLVTIVSAILQAVDGSSVPNVSDATIIVGFIFLLGYGLFRLVKFLIKK